ncbi:hypothetical protein ACFSUJ_34665 [Streptomyces lusitanus]|uniref:hypothetical protein n=1 Tax=Streptomyces lusitanus TaxID=68232 RepID=UPI0036256F05
MDHVPGRAGAGGPGARAEAEPAVRQDGGRTGPVQDRPVALLRRLRVEREVDPAGPEHGQQADQVVERSPAVTATTCPGAVSG